MQNNMPSKPFLTNCAIRDDTNINESNGRSVMKYETAPFIMLSALRWKNREKIMPQITTKVI